MKAVIAIALATIPELRRQKLLIVPIIAVVLSLLGLGGTLLVTDGPIELERAEAESSAWAVGFAAAIGGALYALVVGASLVAREIADGTLLMLAVRPIPRWQIVVGRVLGSAVFIVVALLGVAIVYGIVASMLSGMLAPFEDPLEGLVYGLPVVLLTLCVGTAFSIQGRATAAIGSAVGVCAFALVVAAYVDGWESERHLRSYLADDVREEIDGHDRIVGPAATLIVRALPLGVFASHADEYYQEEIEDYDDDFGTAYGEEPDGRIVLYGRGAHGMMAYPSGPMPTDPVTTEPGSANSGALVDPATGLPIDPAVAGSTPPGSPEKLPDEPPREALQCADFNGAYCLIGYKNAWTRRVIPEAPALHENGGYLMALLAIPFWILVAAVLLTRRRDLSS